MTNRLLLAFLAVFLVAVGAFVYSTSRSTEAEVNDVPSIARRNEVAAAPEEPLAAASPVVDEPEVAPTAGELEPVREVARSEYELELADGHWVEGRVVFPEGTPFDEECFVVADGRSFEHGDEHRVRVGADGRFRVVFSKRTKKGRLRIESKYLFLEKSARVEFTETSSPTLEPRLGGRIAGHFVPEEGIDIGELELIVVAFSNGSQTGTVARGLEFELNGVLPGMSYYVGFSSDLYADDSMSSVSVRPGETAEIEFALALGGTVEGTVVDASGTPVPAASISVSMKSDGPSPGDERTKTDPEGRFRVTGLAKGGASIGVRHHAFRPTKHDVPALAEQRDVTGIRIELEAGETIHGRVSFPTGAPAAGANVEFDHPDFVAQSWVDPVRVKADANGAFVVGGLDDEPIDLRASAVEKTEIEVTSKATGKTRKKTKRTTHRGIVEHVLPGATDVIVQLGTGNAVAGHVVDANGAPILEFQLKIDRVDETTRFPSFDTLARKFFRTEDGAFRIESLPSGSFDVEVTAKGYGDTESRRLSLPRDTELLLFELARAASVAGVVLGPDGVPVPNARVESGSNMWSMMNWFNRENVTSSDGSFRLDELSAGAVALIAHADGYAPSTPVELSLLAGEERTGIELRLRVGAVVTGELLGAEGRPEAKREVVLASGGASESRQTVTDENGTFRFEGADPGTAFVWVDASIEDARAVLGADADESAVELLRRMQTVEVIDNETVHVVLSFQELDPVTVHGRVLVNGEPVVGASITASSPSAGSWNSESADADSEGNYTVSVAQSGEYTFTVHDRGSGSSFQRTAVVPNASEHTLDLLFDTGAIEGNVRDSFGAPLEGLMVSASASSEDEGATGSWASALTNQDGHYALRSVEPGHYAVSVQSMAAGLPGHAGATQDGIVVRVGATVHGVNFELTAGGGVRGTVLLDDAPVSDAWVIVFVEGGQPATAMTDERGTFVAGGIPPGEVTLLARTPTSKRVSPIVPVTIRAGEIARVEVELVEAGSLTISVVGAAGELLDAIVEIDGTPTGFATIERVSDDWVAEPLPPGTYTIRATVADIEQTSTAVVAPGESAHVEIRFD